MKKLLNKETANILLAKNLFNLWNLLPRKRIKGGKAGKGSEIDLPWAGSDFDVSFGHSKRNSHGLGIKFEQVSGDTLFARWRPQPFHANFPGATHGGLVACALDEAMGQLIYLRTGKLAVSLDASIQWHASTPVEIDHEIRAKIDRSMHGIFMVLGEVVSPKGKVLASSKGLYYQPTAAQMIKMLKINDLPKAALSWFRQ